MCVLFSGHRGSGHGIPLCAAASAVREDPLAVEEMTPLGPTRPRPVEDIPQVGSQENLAVGGLEILAVDSQDKDSLWFF